ncbi:MAG: RNA polymerase sigma factor [Gemmataceae bacterium]
MNEAEVELVRRLARGEQAAFAELYDALGAALYRVAWGLLGSRSEAEDAVQDVFVALVQAGSRLLQVENFKAYLFVALRHAALRRRSRERRLIRVPLEEAAQVAAPLAETGELEALLATLPEEQREAVVLKIKGELTFAEMATVLGVSANTAASRYRYALEKLRASCTEQEQKHARP